MQVQAHHGPDELRKMARHERCGRMAVRMLAVAAAMEHKTAPEIARDTGAARRSVQGWIRRYNDGGVDRLRDVGGRGRKPPLTDDQQRRLKARLDAGPLEGDGVCTLRGLDVQRILQEEFNTVRSLSAVYDLLHAMEYNDLMPRPQHRAADPAAQEAFKKSAATDRGNRRGASGEAGGGVVPGRSKIRTTRHADAGLGADRIAAAGGEADAV